MKRFCLLVLTSLLAAGCGGPRALPQGVSVTHRTAPGADLRGLRTYAWVPLADTIGTSGVSLDVLVNLKVAFTDAFAAKGYSPASGDPDLLAALYLTTEGKIQSSDWGYNYQWDERSWGGYWQERRVTTREYEQGTLVLDLIDARRRELLWSGTATAVLPPGDSGEARNRRIDEAVEKLFAAMPAPQP